jgi:hypothetical protein
MSKIRPLLPARIEKGKILWQNPVLSAQILTQLEGEDVKVSIKPLYKSRSLSQNNYYWAVIVQILADFTGYSADEIHEVLKSKFLSDEKEVAGEIIRYAKSTTTLDTLEMEDYLHNIREWASAKLNVFIPLPNEVDL